MNFQRFLQYLQIRNWWPWCKNIYRSQLSGLISYLKTVLESWISGQKSYRRRRFFGFTVFHDQNIIWILEFPGKTAKLRSKIQIAVHKSWLNCCGNVGNKRCKMDFQCGYAASLTDLKRNRRTKGKTCHEIWISCRKIYYIFVIKKVGELLCKRFNLKKILLIHA